MKVGDLRAPFPYFGGKRRVADVVWRAFGPGVPNYIEPFCAAPLDRVKARDAEWFRKELGYCLSWPRAAARTESEATYASYAPSSIPNDNGLNGLAKPLSEQTGAELHQIGRLLGIDTSCDWCKEATCVHYRGSICRAYSSALDERVAIGTVDCPEERESVKRFVDGRLDLGKELVASARALAAPKCECGQPATAGAECSYCHLRVHGVEENQRRQMDVASADARKRNEAALAAEHPKPSKQSRELALGHPRGWPSADGDEP